MGADPVRSHSRKAVTLLSRKFDAAAELPQRLREHRSQTAETSHPSSA